MNDLDFHGHLGIIYGAIGQFMKIDDPANVIRPINTTVIIYHPKRIIALSYRKIQGVMNRRISIWILWCNIDGW